MACNVEKHRFGPVNFSPLEGGKQENGKQVQEQEKQDELENRSHLLPLGFGHFENDKAEGQHNGQNPCVIGQHAGN